MATREEVYGKFGITAEAAQLFETELITLLLTTRGLNEAWHVSPNPEAARKALDDLDASTLGSLLSRLKGNANVQIDDALKDRFASALKARNRLSHGFYERHNFRIQTDEGRDKMIADLEVLHTELFAAWQIASAMTDATTEALMSHTKARADPNGA